MGAAVVLASRLREQYPHRTSSTGLTLSKKTETGKDSVLGRFADKIAPKNSTSSARHTVAASKAVTDIRQQRHKFRQMVRGERDFSRGEIVKRDGGTLVRIIPGKLRG